MSHPKSSTIGTMLIPYPIVAAVPLPETCTYLKRPSNKGMPIMRLNSTGEERLSDPDAPGPAVLVKQFDEIESCINDNHNDSHSGLSITHRASNMMHSIASNFIPNAKNDFGYTKPSSSSIFPNVSKSLNKSDIKFSGTQTNCNSIEWLSYFPSVQNEFKMKKKSMLDPEEVSMAAKKKQQHFTKSDCINLLQSENVIMCTHSSATGHIQDKTVISIDTNSSCKPPMYVANSCNPTKLSDNCPNADSQSCCITAEAASTCRSPSPVKDSCQVHVTVHRLSQDTKKKEQVPMSVKKAPHASFLKMNVKVQLANVVLAKPVPSRKKCRASAKKRRRIKRRNESWQLPSSTVTTTKSQCHNRGVPFDSSPEKYDRQHYASNLHELPCAHRRHQMESDSSSYCEKPKITEVPSNGGACKSFRVTLDMTPQSSPDNKSPVWKATALEDGSEEEVAFMFTASTDESALEESSSECDNDYSDNLCIEADDLWESFADQGLCGSLSLNITCNYVSTSRPQKDPVEPDMLSPRYNEIAEANKRWKKAYDNVVCHDISTSKVIIYLKEHKAFAMSGGAPTQFIIHNYDSIE